MTVEYDVYSEDDTRNIGRDLGRDALAGELYCLDGDLGTGKTVFAKGFAEGLSVGETVDSPTFTILKEYRDGRIPLYHFDVYRIADPDEMFEIGYEDFFYGDGVCLVEWASLIGELIPENAIRINIKKNNAKGFDYRKITIEYPDERCLH